MMRRERVRLFIGLAVIAALLGAFGLIADEALEGDTKTFDIAVLMLFRNAAAPTVPLGPPWLFEAARDITALGSFSVLGLIVAGIVIQLVLIGERRTALFVLVAVVGGTVISTVLKAVFNRPRPDLTGAVEVFTASFPSGHATVSAVVYLTMGAILAERASRRGLRVFYIAAAVFLTLLVGVSRVYLGVHYPTDVLAGWSLGTAWALVCLGVAVVMRVRGEASS